MLVSPKCVHKATCVFTLALINGAKTRAGGLYASAAALMALWFVPLGHGYGATNGQTPALLPSGFLSVKGAQIVGPDGAPVRIASVGLTGMNVVGGRLQLVGPFEGMEGHVTAMQSMGFNCVRIDWIDKTLDDAGAMAQLDAFVATCKKAGLKVVFDNHNNEATPADWANAAQQKNGLWFDTGPGTDGTDGSGKKGTISAAKYRCLRG